MFGTGGFGRWTDTLSVLGANVLLHSTLLIAAGLLAARFLRKRGAALESAMLRATLLAVFVSPVITWFAGAAGMHGLQLAVLPAADEAVLRRPGAAKPAPAVVHAAPLQSTVAEARREPRPRGAAGVPSADGPAAAAHRTSRSGRGAGAVERRPRVAHALMTGAIALWGTVSLLLLGRLFVARYLVRRARRAAIKAPPALNTACRAIAEKLGVQAPPVLVSAALRSPCLAGIWRPAILVPSAAADAGAQHDVLLHELAHLVRRDCMWNLLSSLAASLLFFQPLLWRLARRVRQAADEVCDDYVLEFGSDRGAYARRLVELADRLQPDWLYATVAVGVVTFQSSLGRRVSRILDGSRALSLRTGQRALSAIVLAAVCATLLIGLLGVHTEPAAAGVNEVRSNVQATRPRTIVPVQKPRAPQGTKARPVAEASQTNGNTADDPRRGEQPRSQRETAPEVLAVRLVDGDGQPVQGATVGRYAYVDRAGSQQWQFGVPRVNSDQQGQGVLNWVQLFGRSDKVLLYALHQSRGMAAFLEVPRDSADSPVEMVLQPACRVRGRLASSGLEAAGRSLTWTNVYVHANNHRPISYVSEGGPFELYLPPGEYRLQAYGTDTYNAERTIEVKPGQAELDVGAIDLPASRTAMLFGKPAPELRGIKGWKNGDPITLAELRGKVVLLDFWGSWCGPCIYQMPYLMDLHDAFGDRGLVIVAVHDDSVASISEMDAKLERVRERRWFGRDLPFLVALDGGGDVSIAASGLTVHGATTAEYGITGFPTTLLVDRDGTLLRRFSPLSEMAVAELEDLLGVEPKPPVWRKRFNEVYRLEDGEILRRIAPPFIAERRDFYTHEMRGQAEAIPETPGVFLFHWDGTKRDRGTPRFSEGLRLAQVLGDLGLGSFEYEGPDELLRLRSAGDWICRADAPIDARLKALEGILAETLGRRIRFQRREAEREVIVARGTYEFRPLTGTSNDARLHIYSDKLETDSNAAGGGTGTLGYFLRHVGNLANRPVVDLVEDSEETEVTWTNHSSALLGGFAGGEPDPAKLELVLRNVARQTTLDLKLQRRTVGVWFVSEQ